MSPPVDITVVSTGLRVPFEFRTKCLRSVERQVGVHVEHIYIDAGEQTVRREQIENWCSAISTLPKERIVVLLDGDDWLKDDFALARIQGMYTKLIDGGDVWLTYGSFEYIDGTRPAWVTQYDYDDFRKSSWRATHLRTFKAGLFQKIHGDDFLMPDGKPIQCITDKVVMFPMLEMAGLERIRFCPDILCVYHDGTPDRSEAYRIMERGVESWLRGRKPYEKIEKL